MKIDKDKQREAQQKAQELLTRQEQKRAEQRLLKLVGDLKKGHNEVLLNDELMERLPDLIGDYCQIGELEKAKSLFEKLGECACSENKKLRERSVMTLSFCFNGLNIKDHPDLIGLVSGFFLRWLRIETEYFSACNSVCKQLQENGSRMLEEGIWKDCSVLLDVFYQIQSGTLQKSNAIRSVVCRAQDEMASKYVLEELTLVSLRGRGERRQLAESILTRLGRKAATHLLETLLHSKEKEDRLRLVGLIPAIGNASVPVLKGYLQKKLPWYGIRNIILIIAAVGDQALIPLIVPFFEHEDIRVQQQALDCIVEVAEENLGDYLLKALFVVNDTLKVGLVDYIGQLGVNGANEAFLDLLAHRDDFSSEACDKLLQKLVIQIRLSDSIRAVNLLNMIAEERRGKYDPQKDLVLKAVKQSLHILEPRLHTDETSALEEDSETPVEQMTDGSYEDVSFDGDPVKRNEAHKKVHKINKEVTELLGKNLVAEASQLLYEKCVIAAESKDFVTAEMLRDRIVEVDPNALAEVIQAGEKIEVERSSAINSHHISIWKELYDSLTTDEFNALYFALESKNYATGSIIVEQGTDSPTLYFINSGKVRLTCWRDKEEIFLKRIGAGEIVGAVPFFDASVWTVALTSLSETNIHILKREKFLELLEQFPALEPCLYDYCAKTDNIPELLKMSGEDRRGSVRYPLSLIVKHTLLDTHGKAKMRSFKGKIFNLSSSGLAFAIRISRKENARLMLGRGIKTVIPIPGTKSIECTGTVVAVRLQQTVESDYSVFVKFNDSLATKTVKRIVE